MKVYIFVKYIGKNNWYGKEVEGRLYGLNTKFIRYEVGDLDPHKISHLYFTKEFLETKKGIDITVEHPTGSFNVQVKPFISVNSFVEPDGDTFFEVKTYLDINKYSEKNVNVFMFVDVPKSEFILFKNKKNKIGQMANNIVRFYEPPLYTNMVFDTKEKRKSKKFEPTNPIFGVETDVLKNLEFRKSQIDKLIQKQKDLSPK